jgi:FtsP/CotA-like multicopper oxidase with cupredoxin domain
MLSTLVAFVLGGLLSAPHTVAAPTERCSCPVRFEIDLTWEPVSPDGFTRNGILINGQFPGPQLNVNQNDDVEFLVHNHLPYATAVHFHGIEQLNTPWSDGVPGLSQRLIEPGASFLYRWNANEYGTYWYHAHSRSQLSDGMYGAIVVKPAPTEPTAFGAISNDTAQIAAMRRAEDCPIPLMVSDWNHFTSEEFDKIMIASNTDDVCPDSVLINGKGSVFCLPQAEINSLTSPALLPLLNGTTLTAKG